MKQLGRKPHIDPPVEWRINLPQSLVIQVELLLYDPAKQRVGYASRSDYIQQLIRSDLANRKEPQS